MVIFLAALQGLGCAVTELGIQPDRFETIRDPWRFASAGGRLSRRAGPDRFTVEVELPR